MEYVKKFLHVEGVIGHGAFGRVLVTSPLQNQTFQPQQPPQLTQQVSEGPSQLAAGPQSICKTPAKEANPHLDEQVSQKSASCDSKRSSVNLVDEKTSGSSTRFALKCLHPIVKPQRLASELRYLRDLGGNCNVVQMHTAHLYRGSLYIVMELIEHDRFLDIVAQLDHSEIMEYMRNLLIALQHVHSRNIMHRDIKPANFLYNRKNKKFLLVDFGLAQPVRMRQVPLDPRSSTTPSANSYASSTKILSSPKTPTSTTRRLITSQELFPKAQDSRRDLYTTKNTLEGHQVIATNVGNSPIIGKPTCRYIQFPPSGTPETPNNSIKRQLPNPTDFNNMLKKLKVSNHDEIREPVRLTVGAYESPVTHNDSLCRRTMAQSNKFSTPTIPYRRTSRARCDCRGKAKTCSSCMSRPDSVAPRSGTPGYKAPEILLRYPFQNTAIDMWSAGVVFASLLSGHTPFFRDVDDTTSLAEIITILGSHRVVEVAKKLNIRLTIKPEREPVDIVRLCRTIRSSSKDRRDIEIPDQAFDLLKQMLDPNPQTRITASEALKHSWFEETIF